MSASPSGIFIRSLVPTSRFQFSFFLEIWCMFAPPWLGGGFGNKKQVLALTGLKEGFRDTVKNKINEISQSHPCRGGSVAECLFELPTI